MFADESAWPFVRTPLARSVVKDALEKLPAERNCYQLIGGTLVPKTVEGVLPQVSATLTNVSPAAVGTPRLPMGCRRTRAAAVQAPPPQNDRLACLSHCLRCAADFCGGWSPRGARESRCGPWRLREQAPHQAVGLACGRCSGCLVGCRHPGRPCMSVPLRVDKRTAPSRLLRPNLAPVSLALRAQSSAGSRSRTHSHWALANRAE